MSSRTTKDRIIEDIDRHFISATAPETDEIVDDIPSDMERQEIKAAFSSRARNEVSFAMVLKHAESLFLFTPKAWVYYAPVYMKTMLARFRDAEIVVDIFVSTLAQYGASYQKLLTPEQRRTIVDVLRWLLRRLDREYWKRPEIHRIIERFERDI